MDSFLRLPESSNVYRFLSLLEEKYSLWKRKIRNCCLHVSMSEVKEEELVLFQLNNQKDTFKLLFMLWNKGKLYGGKIRRLGMNDRTLIKVRDVLKEHGLILLTAIEGSRRLYYELTPKGKRVVEKLVDLERQLISD
jgi:DNA-binding MarR family transcriptional regulator